ncbi:hypothetical protein E1264_07065 [Actinomadura sp. KC216]|uniref:hypothetical protein n=1 Tax=Actinomadura sp. KC216 TaxID=2530370 RepID=UPI001049D93C|nr:hypothetical protein [Actinomadura sp. KC216]TDB89854.1 hypothetical protein E1264_07065 [Actinomadura sp. KC216]
MDAHNDGAAGAFFLTSLLGVIGAIALAVGLYRSATVPKAAAVLIGLGPSSRSAPCRARSKPCS